MRRYRTTRKAAASVEFAICAPILLIIGFGFINVGMLVQLKHNSKMIGHLAATEVFKAPLKNATAINQIEAKFMQIATDLGIHSFELDIQRHSADVVVVKTNVSVPANYSLPTTFVTSTNLETETYVFSRLE